MQLRDEQLIETYRRAIERAGPSPAQRRKMKGLNEDPPDYQIAILDDILRKSE